MDGDMGIFPFYSNSMSGRHPVSDELKTFSNILSPDIYHDGNRSVCLWWMPIADLFAMK